MTEGTKPSRRAFVHGAASAVATATVAAGAEGQDSPTRSVRLAVVTGSHPYDVLAFHRLFRGMRGIDAYVQHLEDFAWTPEPVRDAYDAVLLYFMPMQPPTDPVRSALERLGAAPQGVIVLHHALLAYPQWEHWSDIVGIANRSFGFHPNQQIRVRVSDPRHPITRGLRDWDMTDETYTMADAGSDSTVLATVDHPKSMRTLAWARQVRAARVFCFASGHDDAAWSNPGFLALLTRGIRWAAGAHAPSR